MVHTIIYYLILMLYRYSSVDSWVSFVIELWQFWTKYNFVVLFDRLPPAVWDEVDWSLLKSKWIIWMLKNWVSTLMTSPRINGSTLFFLQNFSVFMKVIVVVKTDFWLTSSQFTVCLVKMKHNFSYREKPKSLTLD